MPDSIAETEQHAQELRQQMFPGAAPTMLDRPNSGDLVDSAIEARQNYENQRNQLIQRLPYANRRQGAAIAASLRALHEDEANRHWEANQRRIMAHQNATETDHRLKVDRDTEIDEQGANMMQVMGHLDAALRHGQITRDQYNQGLLEAGQRFPLALRHPEAAKHYEFAITEADKQDAFLQRQREREAGRIAGKYGIDVQTDPETGYASIEHTKAAAMQTDRGKQEVIHGLNQEMLQKYGLGTGVSSLFNPVAPHESPDNGKTIDIPHVDPKTGAIAKTNVPMPLFNQMKADFQDRYFAVVPQQQTPTQQPATTADPRTELAQRALNDPNASEAHKAAARQILGIQENAQ